MIPFTILFPSVLLLLLLYLIPVFPLPFSIYFFSTVDDQRDVRFAFDRVFDSNTSQEEVFEHTTK